MHRWILKIKELNLHIRQVIVKVDASPCSFALGKINHIKKDVVSVVNVPADRFVENVED